MSVTADRVIVELEAKIDRYNADVRRAEREFRDATNRIERQSGAVSRSVSGAMGAITGALAGVSLVALAKSFLEAAEASKQMEAQLRLATRTFGSLAQAQSDVERLAVDTRSGLTETTALYGNLIRATQALGGTQSEAARATETFSKALKIGGADTQSAASATLQFGQALASGVLRGDEFNSIAEASPRILQLLADAIGKPAGELRNLAADGKLTSDILFKALTDRRFTAGIDEEFRTLPVTFGDAMQQVENAAVTTFGAFDRGGQFSTALANFVLDGAGGFGHLEKAAEDLGIETRAIFAGLSDAFNPLLAGAQSVFGSIRADANYTRDSIYNILKAVDDLRNAPGQAVKTANDRFGSVFGYQLKNSVVGPQTGSNFAGRFASGTAASARRSGVEAAARRAEANGYIVPRDKNGQVDVAAVNSGELKKKPTALTVSQPRSMPSNGKLKVGPKSTSAETLANREEAARQKALRNDEQFESEKFGLNQNLLRARRMTAAAADTVARLELQEIEAARERQNASYQREVSEKKLTQVRADELIALNNQVAAARKSAVTDEQIERQRAAKALLIQSDLNNARDLVAAEGSLANTTEQRRQSALRLLDLEYQLERARLEAVVAAKATTETEIAQQEAAARRLALLPQLQSADRTNVNRQNEGPLAQYRRGLNDPQSQVEQAVADRLQQVDEGITDAITSKLGVKDPLLKKLLDIFIQQNLLKPIYDAIAARQGGASGGGGFLNSIIGAASAAFGGGHSLGGSSISNDLFALLSQGNGVPRASGGYLGPGQLASVNEGASPGRVEGFRPLGGGTIIPLGQMAALKSAGGTTIVHAPQFNLKGAVITRELYADMQRISAAGAAQAGKTAYEQSLRDAPSRLSKLDKLGN